MPENEKYQELLGKLHTIKDLYATAQLLGWDQQVMMPSNGAEARSEAMATVGRIAHEHATADDLGDLLESLTSYEHSLDPDSNEASIIRVARQDYDENRIYPAAFVEESTRAETAGYAVWLKARESKEFSTFLPALERVVELRRKKIDYFKAAYPDTVDDYDALLHDFEPYLPSSEVDTVFARLKEATIPLVQQVVENGSKVDDSFLHGSFDRTRQEALSRNIAAQLGATEEGWRVDPTVHPFATSISLGDIRLTTRYIESQLLSGYFGTMHEFGHGLYESGVSPSIARTPLQRGASMAWHESQSRMFENLVGRSRAHWTWATDVVKKHFPGQFDGISADQFYRAANRMQPSLIRVEADELTYNLHIILRYETERDIFANRVALKDLPDLWNTRMQEYLGIDVPDDTKGVMQDVHWSDGLFGYFPTYTLGNVVSLQLWQRINSEIADLDGKIAAGDVSELVSWLQANVHTHGRKFAPKMLLQKVLGTETFDSEPLIGYLTAKVNDLYA